METMEIEYSKNEYPLMWLREQNTFLTNRSAIGLRGTDELPFIIRVSVAESSSVRDFFFSNGNFEGKSGYWIYRSDKFTLKIFND